MAQWGTNTPSEEPEDLQISTLNNESQVCTLSLKHIPEDVKFQ